MWFGVEVQEVSWCLSFRPVMGFEAYNRPEFSEVVRY